jgi:Lon protease-like protein
MEQIPRDFAGKLAGGEERPLFPLGTVLFPGAWLPLHIFEQRYRQMVARCLEMPEREFAVFLIKEGDEVVERPAGLPEGHAAVPYDVGTIARIVEARPLPDGRSFLLCRGVRRVRLRSVIDERPYLVGRVEDYPDEESQDLHGGVAPPNEALATRATQVHGAAERLLATIEAALPPEADEQRTQLAEITRTLPSAPVDLSYFVPRLLGTATQQERQRLLEAPSAQRRLELELPLLFREQQLIQELQAMRRGATPPPAQDPSAPNAPDVPGTPGHTGNGRFGTTGRPSLN